MHYGKLSELIILDMKKDVKFNVMQYRDIIMNEELYMFWMKSMEELGNVLVMEDEVSYHQGVDSRRREELEKV